MKSSKRLLLQCFCLALCNWEERHVLHLLLPWFLALYTMSCYSGRKTKSWLFIYRKWHGSLSKLWVKGLQKGDDSSWKTGLWRETAQIQGKKLTGELLLFLPRFSNCWWQWMVTEQEIWNSLIFSTNLWCDLNIEIYSSGQKKDYFSGTIPSREMHIRSAAVLRIDTSIWKV